MNEYINSIVPKWMYTYYLTFKKGAPIVYQNFESNDELYNDIRLICLDLYVISFMRKILVDNLNKLNNLF